MGPAIVGLSGHLYNSLSLASLLWGIGKQNSHRCDARVPSGAIVFALRNFIEQ